MVLSDKARIIMNIDLTLPAKKFPRKFRPKSPKQFTLTLPADQRAFCSSHPFCKKLYITGIGHGSPEEMHSKSTMHDSSFTFLYCIKGEGWYSINEERFSIKPNQYFILSNSKSYDFGSLQESPLNIYWLQYEGENAQFITDCLLPRQSDQPVTAAPSVLRLMIFEEIVIRLRTPADPNNFIYTSSSLYAFLASFQKLSICNQPKQEDQVVDALKIMTSNLDKNLSLKELAYCLHLSPSRLSALFKERTRFSPMCLFTSLKIQKACQLLEAGGNSIKAVANKLGYEDQYHFSRVFKNTMGISPKFFKLPAITNKSSKSVIHNNRLVS